MKILVANLGSTSFKYRLFEMADERQLARGGIERIGSAESRCTVEIGDQRRETTTPVADHAAAVRQCLAQLTDPEIGCLTDAGEVSAIGFKAVHGGAISGVQLVTPDLLSAMQEMADVAPAHNPPYIAAMRLLGEEVPEIPLVAAFETGFHATVPDRNRYYPAPYEWAEKMHVKRWGFHGASHRYIATRTAEILGNPDARIISCHLGGSNSLCAIRGGKSVATSMGMSPQSGIAHNNRAGEWSDTEGRWMSAHHPFTSPHEDDLGHLESDPGKVRSRAYDCVANGWELFSGSIRIHRREVQELVFRMLGIDREEAQRKFGHMLEAFEYGAPPHAGIGSGIDRLMAVLLDEPDIREVIAFPKTKSASDPMTGAPAPVSDRQLEELHIAVTETDEDATPTP